MDELISKASEVAHEAHSLDPSFGYLTHPLVAITSRPVDQLPPADSPGSFHFNAPSAMNESSQVPQIRAHQAQKRKAPTLRDHDWEPYRERIIELHIAQDLPLQTVAEIMGNNHSFEAT